MKITRRQYEKAVKDYADIKKAEGIIRTWQNAIKTLGPSVEHQELVEIEITDGELTCKLKALQMREEMSNAKVE